MTAKALSYAEDTLGVHRVHDEAVAALKQLDDKVLVDLSSARDARRAAEDTLADREMLVASNEFGKHPDMAQWRMEKHVKMALRDDEPWKATRELIRSLTDDIEGLEFDKSVLEQQIKIGIARLTELGGYLQYLAAVKLVSNPVTPATTTTPEST